MFNKIAILTLIILAIPLISFAQTNENSSENLKKKILTSAEKEYGLDDRLYTGNLYSRQHKKAAGHPYFINEYWNKGSVFIKGNAYHNLKLKYNISTDELVLKFQMNDWREVEIILDSTRVDSLVIADHLFYNSSLLPMKNRTQFTEVFYKGGFKACFQHFKTYEEQSTTFNPYGQFSSPIKYFYLINKDGEYSRIHMKTNLINYFKPIKKQVKKYMRQHRIIYRKMTDDQLYKLLKYCDDIS